MIRGHGGDIYRLAAELGCQPEEILDFSSNCSPLPFPTGFKEFVTARLHQLHWLPEVDSASIREKLAAIYSLPQDSFLLGSGTTEWIFAIPGLSGLRRAVIPEPTYADYRDAAELAGLEVASVPIFGDGACLGQEEVLDAIIESDPSGAALFLCNPNNPTGTFMEPVRLLELIRHLNDTLFIVDESYAQFIGPDHESSLLGLCKGELPENLLILRSFSKIYGIPGLRVGCLVARGSIMDRLREMARPWAVNRMAQIALSFFLDRPEVVEETRRFCQKEKAWLASKIEGLSGLEPIPAEAHYFLVRITAELTPRRVADELERQKILVRDCSNFRGMEPSYIRISPGLKENNRQLVSTLERVMKRLI